MIYFLSNISDSPELRNIALHHTCTLCLVKSMLLYCGKCIEIMFQ